MTIENITSIIEALPNLIIYILPGYIIILIKSFALSEKLGDKEHVFFKSIALSFIMTLITKNSLILVMISLIGGYLLSIFLLSDWSNKVLARLGINKTFRANIWDDVIDNKNGLWVNAYLPKENVIYLGKLRKYDEGNTRENYHVALSNFVMYSYDGESIVDYEDDGSKWVVLYSKSISRVELLYNPHSAKIKNG